MKQFEVGKAYKVNGPGTVTVIKRTANYITFDGDYSGRRQIVAYGDKGFFGLGECIMVPYPYTAGRKLFVFAGHEVC